MIYALFDFNMYYPEGGMNDCRAMFVAADDDAALERSRSVLADIPGIHLGERVELVRIDDDGDWTLVRALG